MSWIYSLQIALVLSPKHFTAADFIVTESKLRLNKVKPTPHMIRGAVA